MLSYLNHIRQKLFKNIFNYLIQIKFWTWFESRSSCDIMLSLIWIKIWTWLKSNFEHDSNKKKYYAFSSILCLIWIRFWIWFESNFEHDLNHGVHDPNHTLCLIRINWEWVEKLDFHLFYFTCSLDSKLNFLWFESNHRFSVFLCLILSTYKLSRLTLFKKRFS